MRTESKATTARAGAAAAAAPVTYIEAISRALREELARDESVFLLGQDIAEYGGAFKATAGFVEEFGKERIVNTPISESATIGMAVGAALLGRRPVVEMQFADFITCGFNQVVNVAAKMYWRSRRPVPLVIRCPYGGGAGAGAFHSQSNEAWLAHSPGLKVAAPAWPADAYTLLKAAIRGHDPVIYLEHKHLYRRLKEPLPAPAGDEAGGALPFGRARVVKEGRSITVVSWGWMLHRALEAAAELAAEGVEVEVVDLRTLVPLDEETLLASARKTGKLLVVHEAPLTGGFGAEVAARVAEKAFEHLDGPVRRLAYPDTPVPYHKTLEEACLPGVPRIAAALRELHRW